MAYEWSQASGAEADPGYSQSYVVVRDVRTGRLLRRVPTGISLHPRHGFAGIGAAASIAVKANGAVGWIAEDAEQSFLQPRPMVCDPVCNIREEPPIMNVYASDKAGTRLLASGNDVAAHSLALVGIVLHWTQHRQPMSAPLN